MDNYLEVLSAWMDKPSYVLVILITLYAIAGTIDYLIGSINAAYDSNVQYSSRKAQLGIIRKLVTLAVMVLVIPLALMLPMEIGIVTLTLLYSGIVVSEIYSILGHVGIVKDGDKHKNLVGRLFETLLDNLLKEKGVSKDDGGDSK